MSTLLVPRSDVSEFRKRYRWLALGAFVAFFALIVRLFQLQVLNGAEYARIAHENVIRRVTLPTTRGIVRDSQGRILASSRPAFNVLIVPGRVMPSARPVKPRRAALRLNDEPDSWTRIADTLRLNPDERTRLTAKIRDACTTDEDHSPCWRAVLIREDLSRDIVAELKQHAPELPGAEVVSQPIRYYPYKHLSAHAIGYTAEIDAEALSRFRPNGWESMSAEERQKANPLGYEPGDVVGATGVERAWESYLRGQRGWEKRVVDARGRYRGGPETDRLLDAPSRQEPLSGRDLRLTIDIELEKLIEHAMRPYAAGSVVVADVRTGRLLAMYSKPDFDPNELSGGAGRDRIRESFNKLYTDPLRPMLDKTVSGAFQPGSTFKPFSALAALEDKILDPLGHERCDGYLSFGRRVFHCAHGHVHGRVDMRSALAQSCNIYFFKLAESVGMDRIAKIANEFGLGQKTGIGVNAEASGRIPSRSWYSLHYRGQFRIGFTLNTAIGQGATTVTPLQLTLAYAALANGGTVYSPQLVRAIETSDGAVVQDFPPRVRQNAKVAPANLARIQDALYAVVNDPKGTAYPVRDASLEIAGKTGTAETGYVNTGNDDPKKAWYLARDHAWFASYWPAKAPEIALVVLVEHGGSGPTIAAPAAVQIIREYARLLQSRTKSKTQPSGVNGAPEKRKPRAVSPGPPPLPAVASESPSDVEAELPPPSPGVQDAGMPEPSP
jgi:penicillin-binding protein 2